MNTKPSLAAVVVTYNRLQLLKECIYSLSKQQSDLNAIFVINNGSSDGTKEWLDRQNNLIVYHQENVGGAGGFAKGIKEAYKAGYEWIWIMDDDVEPKLDCIEQIKKGISKHGNNYHIFQSNRFFFGDNIPWQYGTKWNFINPFKPECLVPVTLNATNSNDCETIASFPFEGPIIHRKVIENIGLPKEAFFINYDDTEYSLRAYYKGYKVGLLRDVVLIKKIQIKDVKLKPDFKLRYSVRNRIIINRIYGNIFITFSRASLDYLKTVGAILKNKTYKQFGLSRKDIVVNVLKYSLEGFRFKI